MKKVKFVLDISANTHKNDWNYLKRMLDELKEVDSGKHEIIIKHQLFIKAGENIPLTHEVFDKAYYYAKNLGYQSTSSIFDLSSLKFLLNYDIPFVKIANNRNLDWLVGEVPRKIWTYISYAKDKPILSDKCVYLACVSEYPCTMEIYEKIHNSTALSYAISDHTTNWDLFNEYKPAICEIHYKLEDSTGLDAGPFARVPSQLGEVL